MNLISYQITKIDESKGHLHVTFVFDTEIVEKTFDYQAMTGYDVPREVVAVNRQGQVIKDKKGNVVKNNVLVLEHKCNFDLSNPVALDESLKSWASAYISGKEVERLSKQKVSDGVSTLVGVVNKITDRKV